MNGQTFSMLYTGFILVLMAFMFIRSYNIIKLGKKNRAVVDALQKVADENEFDEFIDQKQQDADEVLRNKLNVIKLWGKAYHKHTEEYDNILEDTNLDYLFKQGKNGLTIESNEDAFFYLSLAIPNMLYGNGLNEERKKVWAKLSTKKDILDDQLVVKIGEACEKYYDGKEDKGQSFFEKVLEGDYGEFKYSKSLIGLYKEICTTMLYKIYDENNDERKEECKPTVEIFATRGVGDRWLHAMNIELEKEEQEQEEKEEA